MYISYLRSAWPWHWQWQHSWFPVRDEIGKLCVRFERLRFFCLRIITRHGTDGQKNRTKTNTTATELLRTSLTDGHLLFRRCMSALTVSAVTRLIHSAVTLCPCELVHPNLAASYLYPSFYYQPLYSIFYFCETECCLHNTTVAIHLLICTWYAARPKSAWCLYLLHGTDSARVTASGLLSLLVRPLGTADWQWQRNVVKNGAKTLSCMNISEYIGYVNIFNWMRTTACCLVVGLGLGIGS